MAPRPSQTPLSMTGVGTCVIDVPAGRVEAEARSVNHRFLKVSPHLGAALASLEPLVEERVRHRVERGHVTLTLRWRPSGKSLAGALQFDPAAAKAVAQRLRAVAKAAGIKKGLALRDLLAVPGVLVESGQEESNPAMAKAASKALEGALDALIASRAKEGAHLAAECGAILGRAAEAVARLRVLAPAFPQAYRDRLAARIAALLEGSGVAPDPAHLAREVAGFADRCDVSEELARLEGHLGHAAALLAAGGAVGRKLDFLVQEFHREANTVGSKAADAAMTAVVLDLKADVERLREQVQNFE